MFLSVRDLRVDYIREKDDLTSTCDGRRGIFGNPANILVTFLKMITNRNLVIIIQMMRKTILESK